MRYIFLVAAMFVSQSAVAADGKMSKKSVGSAQIRLVVPSSIRLAGVKNNEIVVTKNFAGSITQLHTTDQGGKPVIIFLPSL